MKERERGSDVVRQQYIYILNLSQRALLFERLSPATISLEIAKPSSATKLWKAQTHI